MIAGRAAPGVTGAVAGGAGTGGLDAGLNGRAFFHRPGQIAVETKRVVNDDAVVSREFLTVGGRGIDGGSVGGGLIGSSAKRIVISSKASSAQS